MTQDPEILFQLAMAEEAAGDHSLALRHLRAAAVSQASTEILSQLARLLVLRHLYAEAREVALRAQASQPCDALSMDTLGGVWSRLGQHHTAARWFQAATAAEPTNVQYQYNLGCAYVFVGQEREALRTFESVIALEPCFAQAHLSIALLGHLHDASARLERIDTALSNVTNPLEQLRLECAAARELETMGHSGEAFKRLLSAKARRKRMTQYDFAQDRELFAAVTAAFGQADFFAKDAGEHGLRPIFVLGMPRSGTTLVERILSSHPEVSSAGELQAMPLAVARLSPHKSSRALDSRRLNGLADASPRVLALAYCELALPFVVGNRRFVDKLPMNFFYVGFIARAFPNAAIVCLKRDGMDTVWSNFKHLFATTSSLHHYSYDPADCAQYIAHFENLMDFWRLSFPGRLLEIEYENLITDPEIQTRRLLAHCGLSWDEACLRFQRNAAPVSTASASQVRKEIYRSSIGRWKSCEADLRPAETVLAQTRQALGGACDITP